MDHAGTYFLTVVAPGYYEVSRSKIELVTGVNFVSVALNAAESVSSTIDVTPEQALTVEHIASSQTLKDDEILAIPATRSNVLENLLAVMPGALRDPNGNLHFHGSPAEEINWLLDGFSVSDPATGRLESDLSVEAIRSVDLFSGRYSVEFGKGSGGTLLLNGASGDNRFRFRTTNFIPGLEQNKGLALSSWRPRLNVAGPIVRNRLWFFNGVDFNLKQNIIAELPKGQDRTSTWELSDFLRVQANLTPSQTLSGDFLFNDLNAPRSGLSPLDPAETTLDVWARRYFASVKHQITLSSKTVVEAGYAAYRSFARDIPQGHSVYQITPFGRSGNFPVESRRSGARDQWLASALLPAFKAAGSHQFKIGLDLNFSRYSQDSRRSGYEFFRLDGTRAYEISYGGSGRLNQSNLENAVYLQDRWAITPWLQAEAGVRWDRDRIISRQILTPRFSFALMPPFLPNSKLSAGIGWVPAVTYLRLFSRDLDQYSVSTRFDRDGATVTSGPAVSVFFIDRLSLAIPTTSNFSVGIEQALSRQLSLQLSFLRKRSRRGYTFVPTQPGIPLSADLPSTPEALYELRNARRELYDSLEISMKRRFLDKIDWFGSYTWSRTYSNAALNRDLDDPIAYTATAGRLPWDVPSRLISWVLFPINKNNLISGLLEWRDGFPFSAYDDEGRAVGDINRWRLPRYFNLNLHYERSLTWRGRRWALRLGADNLTNHHNFALVNAIVGSTDFPQFYGRQNRKLVVRIRWLE
jgi:hypothetical protein